MATNAAAAIAIRTRSPSARAPTRSTACTTTATIAGLSPQNTACTTSACWNPAYTTLSPRMAAKPGSTKSVPAARPPGTPCSSHPT